MTTNKKIRKQDKSVSTFFNGWSEVIQNLPKPTYIDNKKAIATPTNDEIIKKYIFSPSNNKEHFEDLRENMLRALEERDSLSRADERAKVQKEMLNGKLQVKSGTKLGDFLPQSEIRKLVEIVKKEMVEPSLNEARAEGYKQGQIDAVKHLFENKIAMVRAVKVLSEDMQDVAKKAGYKPDDVLFITMEKIEGGMVIKGSVAKCESDELVIKKVD